MEILQIQGYFQKVLSHSKDFLSFFQAADKVTDYNKKGHTLHSNANMGAVAVKELGHGSHTPFRKFVIDDKDDGNKRVICGYSLGRGHPKDPYKKKVVLATNWKDAPKSSLLMHA